MNAIALTTNHETDYRAAMQQAAVAFLFRREGLHLAGDHQVLENCSRFWRSRWKYQHTWCSASLNWPSLSSRARPRGA